MNTYCKSSNVMKKLSIAAATIVALGTGNMASAAILFSEDFENLPLDPFISPSESGGDGTDFTAIPPSGWVKDNTTTPAGGPSEFFGFTFLDKNSWINTAGNQGRNQFTLGSGTVMVADPDEYDDIGNIDPNRYNAFITTPSISLNGIDANTVVLEFHSSFRPYDGQTGTVDVSFDGGANFTNVLTLNSANSGGTNSFSRINESLQLTVDNPNAGDAIFRFGLSNAGNDWWWAVDDIVVSGSKERSRALLSRPTGFGFAWFSFRTKPKQLCLTLAKQQNVWQAGVLLHTITSISASTLKNCHLALYFPYLFY